MVPKLNLQFPHKKEKIREEKTMKTEKLTFNLFIASKIIAAAIVATILAQLLHLDYGMSAGIVAILSVSPTKKETIRTARDRFIAFLLALVIASVSFLLLGVSMAGFFLFLAIYIVICQWKHWNNSMAMNSVLISHFLTTGAMNQASIQNLENYNGSCLLLLEDLLRKAQNVAQDNYMNQFGNHDKQDLHHLQRREKQLHILYNMYKKVKVLDQTPVTGEIIAHFLHSLSENFSNQHMYDTMFVELQEMEEEMKVQVLPLSRDEFEVRATLYVLMCELHEFLSA